MVNNKTWGVAFAKFYGVTYSILIVNGNLLTHWKHAEGMSLRYGVYVMVLLNLLIFFVNGAHYYIIYKKQVPFVGEPALWGYLCGLRLIWWRACSRRL